MTDPILDLMILSAFSGQNVAASPIETGVDTQKMVISVWRYT